MFTKRKEKELRRWGPEGEGRGKERGKGGGRGGTGKELGKELGERNPRSWWK